MRSLQDKVSRLRRLVSSLQSNKELGLLFVEVLEDECDDLINTQIEGSNDLGDLIWRKAQVSTNVTWRARLWNMINDDKFIENLDNQNKAE